MIITLSLIAVIYIGFVAWCRPTKKLVAYSSISTYGFRDSGTTIFNPLGMEARWSR